MRTEVLFPEICNLFGDTMNVEYLRQSGAEIIETSLKSVPAFTEGKADLVYIGSMTESAQEHSINALRPYVSKIKAAMAQGTVFLATGNAVEIFAREIRCDDGRTIEGLGIFDMYAKRDMQNRYNSVYLGKFGDMDIVGFKSQFGHLYGGENYAPLFDTVRGDGRHPGEDGEGIRFGNFYGTYLIGPLLPLNPPFAKYLMRLCGKDAPNLAFEKEAMAVYNKRVKQFKDPKTRIAF